MVRRGKTPVLSAEEARKLLDSIETTTLIGLRDRALIGTRFCQGTRQADHIGEKARARSQASSMDLSSP